MNHEIHEPLEIEKPVVILFGGAWRKKLENDLRPAQARTNESNNHRREKFCCRGSRHESAVAQLFSLGCK